MLLVKNVNLLLSRFTDSTFVFKLTKRKKKVLFKILISKNKLNVYRKSADLVDFKIKLSFK